MVRLVCLWNASRGINVAIGTHKLLSGHKSSMHGAKEVNNKLEDLEAKTKVSIPIHLISCCSSSILQSSFKDTNMRSLVAAALALPLVASAPDANVGNNVQTVNNNSERLRRRRRRLKPFVAKVKFTEHEVDDVWNEVDLDENDKVARVDDFPPVDLPEEDDDDFECKSAGNYCENKHLCDQYTRLYESTRLRSDESKMDCFCLHAWGYEDDYCDETKGFDSINCACDDNEEDDLARDDVELNDPERTQRDTVVACVRYSLDEGEYEWITEKITKKEYTKLVFSDEEAVLPEECTTHFEDCDPSGIVCAEKADMPPDEEEVDGEEGDAEMENAGDEADEGDMTLDKEIEVEERLGAEIEELKAKIWEIETLLDEDKT